MLHGKLYLCPYSAHVENLKVIKPKTKEHVDLFSGSDQNLKSEINNNIKIIGILCKKIIKLV